MDCLKSLRIGSVGTMLDLSDYEATTLAGEERLDLRRSPEARDSQGLKVVQ